MQMVTFTFLPVLIVCLDVCECVGFSLVQHFLKFWPVGLVIFSSLVFFLGIECNCTALKCN